MWMKSLGSVKGAAVTRRQTCSEPARDPGHVALALAPNGIWKKWDTGWYLDIYLMNFTLVVFKSFI